MKLNTKKTIFVGFAFLIICMFWQVYDNIIVKMLNNNFGFNQTWSGVIMALDNVLALFLLPIFGVISDRTKTKRGRRTPFIFWGVILSSILFIGVGIIDDLQLQLLKDANIPIVETIGDTIMYRGVTYASNEAATLVRATDVMAITKGNIGILVAFIFVLLVVLVIMATYRTPAVSLMPDVTPKPLRSKANAIINLMGAAGGVISLGLMAFLANDHSSYILLFVVLAIGMNILLGLFMSTVHEPELVAMMHEQSKKYGLEEETVTAEDMTTESDKMSPEVKKSFLLIMASIVLWFMAYNAATTKFSIYSQIILDMGFETPLLIAQVAAILVYIPIGIIASKVGRKKTIMTGIIILFIAFLLGFIATSATKFLIYFTMSLAGIGWATINVNSYPMIVEMSKGKNIGKYTGYYYTASMAAQIATPILSGAMMDLIGMKSLFAYSAIFSIFALVTMYFVKHGDSKPIPTKAIEAYESLDE
ncbi:MAG: MFS transporter [Bacilli bacterium]